jgi:multicomponent Na+:H+ antiporter subunit G
MTEVLPGFWTTLADAVAAVCLLLGAFFSLSAGVGVLRFGSLLARTHAVAKPQVLGLILLLIAVALRVRSWSAVTMLVLVVAFQLLTSPVAAHMVGRAGVRTGKVDPADLEVDELGDAAAEPRQAPQQPTPPR